MASIVADTHALLWMLDGTLPERSQDAADRMCESSGGDYGERDFRVK